MAMLLKNGRIFIRWYQAALRLRPPPGREHDGDLARALEVPMNHFRRTAHALAIALVLATSATAVAQELKAIAEKGDPAERVRIVKGSKPNAKGEGPGANLAVLAAPPKRIGLVSFYVHDKGSGTGTYYSSTRSFTALTQDGANHFADHFHNAGIAPLKAAFAAQGMELLTPDQFLDSDGKRAAYRAYTLNMGRTIRLLLGAIDKIEKAAASGAKLNQSAVAPGYRLLPAHAAPAAPDISVSLNELRTKLGLDAIVIVRNGTRSDAKGVTLQEIELMLYGPNPVAKQEGTRYIGYLDGQIYVDALLDLKDGALVAKLKKDAVESESYDGYERLAAALGARAVAYLMEEIARP
jgi:hypothetical protein